jgi:hypothetical protein
VSVESPARIAAQAAPGDEELLRRHRPYLRYDSQEDYRVVAAGTIAAWPGNRLLRGKDVIAGVSGEGGRVLTMDILSDGEKSDYLAEAAWPVLAARRLQADPDYANRVYGRVVRGRKVWLQYWMWLYYNPKHLLGFGRHEGDWELVQIALDPETLAPVAATYAQHGHGEKQDDVTCVRWERCEPGCAGPCRHPVVYVAPFSHASYFEPGTHAYGTGIDNPDGDVFEALPEVVPLEARPWHAWPGRWGAIAGLLGKGPRSPARQPKAWDPEKFHRRARQRPPKERRLLWKLGQHTYPAKPLIERAELRADTVVVGYRLRRTMLRRPRWLLVSVHDGGRRDRTVRKRILRVRGREGETRLPLRPDDVPRALTVTASAFNVLRQRSDATDDVPVRPGAPLPLRDDWSARVWKAFHRALLADLARHGASSLADLKRRRFHVLELALDEQELLAVVDSARRAGLIAPLGQERRPDGGAIEADEWAPTDAGRSRMQGFVRVGLKTATMVPWAVVAGLVGRAAAPWISNQNPVVFVFCAATLLVLAWTAWRYGQGAGAPVIAKQWSRHAVELPVLNRWQRRLAFTAVPALVLAVGAAAFALLTISLWFAAVYVAVLAILLRGTRELGLIVQEARAAREQGM